MVYLVNLYFCAEHACGYFNILKEKYIDIKMIEFKERNIEKSKLLKVFDSTIKYEEPEKFKDVWIKLKKENILIKNNTKFNSIIKKYVIENDEKKYIEDLNYNTKLKIKKFNYGNQTLNIFWLKFIIISYQGNPFRNSK